MSPTEFCRNKVVRSNSNFTVAFALLNNEKREAMEALYSYCREIDDIGDSGLETDIARRKLDWWEEEICNALDAPTHPITIALRKPIESCSLPITDLLKIIGGVRQDLNHKPFASFIELESYSDHVAGAVGRLSARIFGDVRNAEVLTYASELGIACQFTNILRDIAEDRENRRVYIPLELSQKYDLSLLHSEANDTETVRSMCQEFYAITAKRYRSAFSSLPNENYKEQRPGIIMGMIYLNLLKKIKKTKFNVFDKRISLNTIEKLNAVLKGLWGKISDMKI
ncbi:MAG: squalene synthase HpnD [Burkholderiaceae bacterium]|nr:MAG: squalene synthase HpnD [Burkholderiaceae bacterium]|tara:strand:- start:1236 stop:2084 length:849 start_codon:yes stop_codon:yes gene_type:complete